MKFYLKTIGFSLLPTFLMFIGKSEGFFDFLIEHNFLNQSTDISKAQFYSFAVGVFWAGLVTPVQLANCKAELADTKGKFIELLRFNKETYFRALQETLQKQNKSLMTRIFVPDKSLKAKWEKIWSKKQKFKAKDIEGLTDPLPTKSLSFEIVPNTQGMVGKTCAEKVIIVDCDVQADKYNLSHFQKSKTNDVRFCATAPIFDQSNEVVAVLAVDSSDELSLEDGEEKQFKDQIVYYCAFIDKHLKF